MRKAEHSEAQVTGVEGTPCGGVLALGFIVGLLSFTAPDCQEESKHEQLGARHRVTMGSKGCVNPKAELFLPPMSLS